MFYYPCGDILLVSPISIAISRGFQGYNYIKGLGKELGIVLRLREQSVLTGALCVLTGDHGPYLAPSANDLVNNASVIPSLHSTQSLLFPPQTHVEMTLCSRGRFSNSATDQEKRGLKSMVHYSDAILRAQAWSVRTAGEARVFFLQSYVTLF